MDELELSIIAPAHNEEGNIGGLVSDVRGALEAEQIAFEFLIVDDGSSDGTRAAIAAASGEHPWVKGLSMPPRPNGRGNGQSAAFRTGILAARGSLVAFLDADRQNDPSDLPAMLRFLREASADLVQGDRSANRRDGLVKRVSSWIGRSFRSGMLGDSIRDTGCSIRVLRREIALQLPLQFQGMHRFIPFYARMLGYKVVEIPVSHRSRVAGSTKYGVFERALPGLQDLFTVRWMRGRLRRPQAEVIAPAEPGDPHR